MTTGPVIVAYDGSDEARSALLWALGQDGPIVPVAVLGQERSPLPVLSSLPHAPDEADRAARRIVARWDEDGADLRDVAELRIVRGEPGPTLARIAAQEQASLVVVGHRRGRRAAALRASVAEDLVGSAPCPVVFV